ncbi:MAG: hypothetical protein V1882_09825 [Candidatus Omnitrophota bacterium]
MEKKIVPTLIHFIKYEIGAILASHFRNERRARIILILIGLLCFGTSPLFAAAEGAKKQTTFQQIVFVQKRGVINFASSPAELFYAFKKEKADHPKAWPLTYIPSFFTKMMIRIGSSVNDLIVLPWYVAVSDDTPLTRRFELPDYVWQKE